MLAPLGCGGEAGGGAPANDAQAEGDSNTADVRDIAQDDVPTDTGAPDSADTTAPADTDTADAEPTPECPSGSAWDVDSATCVSCSGTCDGEGQTGAFHAVTIDDTGKCLCATQDGWFYTGALSSKAFPCDDDGDGWVRQSAKAAIESPDPAIAANARCDLRLVDRVRLVNEYGEHLDVLACDSGFATEAEGCTSAAALPLYESDRNDDAEGVALDVDVPVYGAGGRKLEASELNPLTKACVTSIADFNDDSWSDVEQWQQMAAHPDAKTDPRWLRFAYFVELATSVWEPGSSGGPGRLVIAERSRCDASFPIGYGDGADPYWRSCTRRREPAFGTPAADQQPGFDFAEWSCSLASGSCPVVSAKPVDACAGDTTDGVWRGMGHASQFECVVVVDPPASGQPAVAPEVWPATVDAAAVLSTCAVSAATQPPNDGKNPSTAAVSCTPVAPAAGLVGFAARRYSDYATPGDYEGGCVAESVEWDACIPGYGGVSEAYGKLACSDIDECDWAAYQCDLHHETCANSDAGFTCTPLPTGLSRIMPGTFQMGGSDAGALPNETPVNTVTLTRRILMGVKEVTQGEWNAAMPADPRNESCAGATSNADCPVTGMTWWGALRYANARSVMEGLEECYAFPGAASSLPGVCCSQAELGASGDCLFGDLRLQLYACNNVDFKGPDCTGYRLPTEAEWEYAARAGSAGPTYGPIDDIAVHGQALSVGGSRAPTPWGSYDLIGNAAELVWDGATNTSGYELFAAERTDPRGVDQYQKIGYSGLHPGYGLVRGGSAASSLAELRASARIAVSLNAQARADTGFRVVRTEDATGGVWGTQGKFTALSIGEFACGLLTDGRLTCWSLGTNTHASAYTMPDGRFRSIAVGGSAACLVRMDGTPLCVGSPTLSSGVPPDKLSAVAVTDAGSSALGIREDGTLVSWGASTGAVPGGAFEEITGGANFFCARRGDGTVTCWGGLVGQPDAGDTFVRIDAGGNHACGVTSFLTMRCWGQNIPGASQVPGTWGIDVAFSHVATDGNTTCLVPAVDTPYCMGPYDYYPEELTGPNGQFTKLWFGRGNLGLESCGLRFDQSVSCKLRYDTEYSPRMW